MALSNDRWDPEGREDFWGGAASLSQRHGHSKRNGVEGRAGSCIRAHACASVCDRSCAFERTARGRLGATVPFAVRPADRYGLPEINTPPCGPLCSAECQRAVAEAYRCEPLDLVSSENCDAMAAIASRVCRKADREGGAEIQPALPGPRDGPRGGVLARPCPQRSAPLTDDQARTSTLRGSSKFCISWLPMGHPSQAPSSALH